VSKRSPAAPPELAGFRYIQLAGSGGYADVFLYEQAMPNRRVAIKVLDPGAVPGGGGRNLFTAEANLMAKVSAHPYIVQVFQADIAPDGRPYLIMEYYPGPNFYDRARQEQMSVAEVLRVGVQLASAVETAHRAGILHRDIKPANVLTSEYRRPGLADFGIAAAVGPDSDSAEGVSIPWSPPEALGDAPPDRRGDVYSLAATIYTLLAGRSPFEIPGGDNRPLALIGRIERSPVPPVGRADVPSSLERVLANAMAKDPAHRPATAADFGRQLQAVESELRLSVTVLELADDERAVRARSDVVDDDSTRVKGVTEIRAQDAPGSAPISRVPSQPAFVAPQTHPRQGSLAESELGATVVRGPATVEPAAEQEALHEGAPSGIKKSWIIAGAAAAVLVMVIAAASVLGGGGGSEAREPTEFDEFEVNDNIGQPIAVTPAAVPEVVAVDNGDGTFTFTWEDRGEGVTYAVTEDGSAGAERVEEPTYTSSVPCIEVEVIASSGLISAPTQGCA
jgi:eukaryotic-like serine/threonine-protein kinase